MKGKPFVKVQLGRPSSKYVTGHENENLMTEARNVSNGGVMRSSFKVWIPLQER
jgi:hypothetical protein